MVTEGFRVLVTDNLSPEGVKVLKGEGLEVDVQNELTPQELLSIISDYDALIVRSKTKVRAEVIERATRLKVIGRAGVGLDNIDVEAATRRGIVVMNCPEANTISTAEHALAMLLSLARNIPQANISLKGKKWEKKKFVGVELYDKTLGILGLGRIGSHLAKCARGIGMKVLAYDPFLSPERSQRVGVELVSFEGLLKRSDFISVHTPLTSSTKHLIGEKEFSLMKKGIRILNCARGGIIDEEALYRALKGGKVAGAALDVFEKEPPGDNPLLTLDNVVVTPHLGASTQEAQFKVAVGVARQVAEALKKGVFRNAVNIPQVEPELWRELKPYLELAEGMGRLQAQMVEGNVESIRVKFSGSIVDYDLLPLTNALLKGFLGKMVSEMVNLVNAPLLARERGIEVIESKSSRSVDFANLITMEVITSKGETSLEGTVLGREDKRLVNLKGYKVDVPLEGYLLITFHQDKPGLIGRIGLLLGEHRVNIARLSLDRNKIGGKAAAIFNIDSPPPEVALQKMVEIEGLNQVKVVKV